MAHAHALTNITVLQVPRYQLFNHNPFRILSMVPCIHRCRRMCYVFIWMFAGVLLTTLNRIILCCSLYLIVNFMAEIIRNIVLLNHGVLYYCDANT